MGGGGREASIGKAVAGGAAAAHPAGGLVRVGEALGVLRARRGAAVPQLLPLAHVAARARSRHPRIAYGPRMGSPLPVCAARGGRHRPRGCEGGCALSSFLFVLWNRRPTERPSEFVRTSASIGWQ